MDGLSWIALDWGTSKLRAWAMAGDGRVLASATSDAGMGSLGRDGFEPALLDAVAGWLVDNAAPVPVFACGMVGARQGWTEAAYRAVPCAPVGPPLTTAPTRDPRIVVRIVPGLMQARPGADVMRGEETQIAGLLHLRPAFDGVACLPGTHSKWAALSAGDVTSFQTVMTGELFALLSAQSVLRHSMPAAGIAIDLDGVAGTAFDGAVSDTLSRPESLAARLFAIRAGDLTQGTDPAVSQARLSGLLIGSELAATKPWWLGREVVLVGAEALSALYARALKAQGVAARREDATRLVLAGLTAARHISSPEGPP
jgi:2-dehydro-3-deoxygalactonokinase